MSAIEDDVLTDVKNNLDERITAIQQEIVVRETRIDRRRPAITETNIRRDELNRDNRQDQNELEKSQNRLARVIELKDKLDSGELEVKISKKR